MLRITFTNQLLILLSFFFTSLHAAEFNVCIANMDKHAYHEHSHYWRCWLDLSNCEIKNEHIKDVLKYASSSHFQTLILNNNNITAEGAVELAEQLPKGVYFIFLDKNHIGSGVKALAQNENITLSLQGNELGDEEIREFAKYYKKDSIDLSNNLITNRGLAYLAQNDNLVYLEIANNKFDEKGLRYFHDTKSLRKLDVSQNNLSADSALTLAKISHLNHIVANDNYFGDEGAFYLANKEIVPWYPDYHLELKNNQITDLGAKALARINSTFLIFYLEKNQITDEGARALAENEGLSWLQLGDNRITDEGAIALANSQIKRLAIDSNGLTDKIVNAFAKSCKIHVLDVRYNHLSRSGIERLKQSQCGYYKQIYSDGNDG